MAIYKTLEELRAEKLDNHAANHKGYFDYKYKVKPPKSAAQLETLVQEYVHLSGGICTKVVVAGREITNKTFVTDVLGRKNSITNSTFIPSPVTKGTSDLIIGINGQIMYCEIKFSKHDRQSAKQKEFQQAVELAGCYYVIAHTLKEFITIFNEWK